MTQVGRNKGTVLITFTHTKDKGSQLCAKKPKTHTKEEVDLGCIKPNKPSDKTETWLRVMEGSLFERGYMVRYCANKRTAYPFD